MIERKDMIDLEIIETNDPPKDIIEWLEKGYTANTIVLTVRGPNPITGNYSGRIIRPREFSWYHADPHQYAYRDDKGVVDNHRDLKRIPRKYRNTAVQIPYSLSTPEFVDSYYQDPNDQKSLYYFKSQQDVKDFLLSDSRIAKIRRDIAPLYDKETPMVSYKGTV